MGIIKYSDVKKYKDFRIFRRTRRVRALIAAFCIALFWVMMYYANNPDFNQSYKGIIYAILALFSVVSMYSLFIAFIKRPRCYAGVIEGARSTGRVVRRGGDLDGSYIMEYGIQTDDGKIYGKNVSSYTGKNYKKFEIGDEVLCVSYGKNNTYMIKKVQL